MPSSSTLVVISACIASVVAVEAALRIRIAAPLAKLKTASTLSLSTMSNKDLSDEQKSELVLAQSRDIFVASLDLLVRIAIILGAFLLVFLSAAPLTGSGLGPYWDALGMWWVQAVIVAVAMLFLWGRLRVSRRL